MKWDGLSGKHMFRLLMKIQGQQVLLNFTPPYLWNPFSLEILWCNFFTFKNVNVHNLDIQLLYLLLGKLMAIMIGVLNNLVIWREVWLQLSLFIAQPWNVVGVADLFFPKQLCLI